MRERRQKHVDRHKETKADKVSENEEDDKHCKDRARPLASSGLKLPLTALKRQGINNFVSLPHENMAWNPIIPGYRDVRAPSSSLIPQRRGYGTTCIVY